MEREPVVLSWSGGKDSSLALHAMLADPRYEVVGLLTSIAEQFMRVSHHGVRVELLEEQAASIGLPLHKLMLPSSPDQPCTNAVYEEIMERTMLDLCERGVRCMAFGDIFLEDLRAYRESNLAKVAMHAIFPLWKRDTRELAASFSQLGFKGYLSCVEAKLGRPFAGRALDDALIADLPAGIDPCGERGEYHTFVYDGPIFRWPLPVQVGEVVERDTRFYADLLLNDAAELAAVAADIPPVR